MSAAGYDPEALARCIDREPASSDKGPGSVFSPLPRLAGRLEAIRRLTVSDRKKIAARHYS
jgi:hypothetical protein